MPNTYFQFKQFRINQERAALKVSTDSCLFGAWVANELRANKYEVKNALDIGAGTGLLMLMIAQQCDALISGIEIDKASYEQANENIKASNWNSRLNLFLADVKQFQFHTKYDLIISNPPFYENDLKGDKENRNMAMHDSGLKLYELLEIAEKNLSHKGKFAVLLPYFRADGFVAKAKEHKLYLLKRVNVNQTDAHSFFRSMLLFQNQNTVEEIQSLAVKNASNEYSDDFIQLLKDYYLYL